jgi:molecular chaperone DnaK
MIYGLGVDLGTTRTAAAVSDASGTRALRLGRDVTVSSVVYATASGELITGDQAEAAAKDDPQRASHAHKRRLADPVPLTIGGSVRSPASLMAAQLRDVVAAATTSQGGPPQVVVLTCPAVWGPYRREHFLEVPRLAGIPNVRVVTEPDAAAMHYSVERRLGEGEKIAVYDLGGGTFDATVLRAWQRGTEILGTPEGVERLGGFDFDDALLAFADQRLNGAITALDVTDQQQAKLLFAARESCRLAKETLSVEPDTTLHLELPGGVREISVSRLELNELIKPFLALTTDALARSITSAGLRQEDLAGVLVAGGSSHIPLVTQMVSASFDKPVHVALDPKFTVALGAAAIARVEIDRRRARPPVPPPGFPKPPPRPPFRPPVNRLSAPPPPRRAPVGKPAVVIAAIVAAVLCVAGVAAVVISPSRDESPPPASSTRLNLLHDGKDAEPFHSMIGSDADWAGSAVPATGGIAHPAISVRPSDQASEGDGRHVRWTGTGQFYLQNPRGHTDARAYVGQGVLAFDVTIAAPAAGVVSLAMHCEYPCSGRLDATSAFNRLPRGEKTAVRVPVACFTAKGLDPSKVDVPFLVHSTGAFEAAFSEVRWEETGAKDGAGVIPCSALG